ncbi:PIN domain nuclease [Mesorhizobium sp. BAC0120]|uniref:type II toxin-antitoxin system VapC family toxin n=1 Tax=Mesorhizobium sp. BAC0120 TaxID=3090670 RepID=UPI00298D0855|nr:PIN domain nuclease [Mesorhizobium sp. BAC0120]MDW6021974.1 PIN domain nuclease [Mesorhizobium sp. BAC0120]
MIVVDSSVWIAKLRNVSNAATERFNAIRDTDEIIVGDIVLLEVLQGARDDRDAARLEYYLRSFRIARMMDPELAVRTAESFRQLRSKGITIRKTVDLAIGTFCIDRGYRLLHNDRDFSPMVEHLGLRVT